MSYLANAKILKKKIDENQAAVDLIEEAGGIRKSDIQQSDKLRFDWRRTYVGETLVYTEYVPQEHPRGTADDPIPWDEKTVLYPNFFYDCGNVRKVWTGKAGVIALWDDERWEEF